MRIDPMRPMKLSREQVISTCAIQFKKHGYHGTSMQMLAQACGLTKGAFYHHYSNKEQLVVDILKEVNQHLQTHVFKIATQNQLAVIDRFEAMHRIAIDFFITGEAGCLMAIISIEAMHSLPQAKPIIEQFFLNWQSAMQTLYAECYPGAQAFDLAKQSVADYEGAILMFRITQDQFYINHLKQRIVNQFAQPQPQP